MWHVVHDNDDLASLLSYTHSFHDSCIKELKYLSGAYVDEELSMWPVNDRRSLGMVIQCQSKTAPMIEMEFEGLKYLKLIPQDDGYTCEILDATMIMKKDCIYWCDSGGLAESDLVNYGGTIICASKLRWRSIKQRMGPKEFYSSKI